MFIQEEVLDKYSSGEVVLRSVEKATIWGSIAQDYAIVFSNTYILVLNFSELAKNERMF